MNNNNYQSWIDKSEDNLKWANDNFKLGNYALTCFLSQQSIELLLKGYLYFKKDVVSPKTHQLLRLAEESKKVGLNLDVYASELSLLSTFYFESRYPDNFNDELEKESTANEAIQTAKKLREEILKSFA
jgi:HEPN domain-containing protein